MKAARFLLVTGLLSLASACQDFVSSNLALPVEPAQRESDGNASVVAPPVAPAVEPVEVYDGQRVTLPVGGEFLLRLQNGSGTGGTWRIDFTPPFVSLVERSGDGEGGMGGSSSLVLRFRVNGPGEGTVMLSRFYRFGPDQQVRVTVVAAPAR